MSAYTEALAAGAAYCSRAERCVSEVLKKVEKYSLAEEEKKRLIEKLKQDAFLNEERYVRAFVHDKFSFERWGRLKIFFALRQKKLPQQLVDEALNAISEEEYRETLCELLRVKKQKMKALDPYEQKARLIRYAYSRGFEPEWIKRCLDVSDDVWI